MRKLASISSVCEVNPRIPASLRSQPDLRVSFLPMASVQESGTIQDVSVRSLGDVVKGYSYFEEGDVLVAKITPCMENGKAAQAVGLPKRVGFGSTEFHVLRAGPDVDGRYLFHMVWNPMFRHAARKRMTGSAGQRRVPVSFFDQFSIPLPPFPEQRRIAAILDKADAVRQKRQQTLNLADQFLRSAFLDLFGDPVTNPKGWPVKKLEDFADVRSGMTKGRKLGDAETISVPYMRVANVQDGTLDLSDIKEIEVRRDELEKYRLREGDVLLTEGGDPDKLGRGSVWTGSIDPCVHQNHIFSVRIDRTIADPHYLSALIGSVYGKRHFLRIGKQTTGIATINKTQLSAFPAFLPPVGLQENYAAVVVQFKRTFDRLTRTLCAHENLSSSMMQRAFRGEL